MLCLRSTTHHPCVHAISVFVSFFTKVDFYNGLAHKGFVKMATAILEDEETLSAIWGALTKYEDEGYELIITGHSLGAVVACLVNIKCHCDDKCPKAKIRCVGYGCPPAYAESLKVTNENVTNAIANTTCYIHEDDCVPFLSGNSVFRLAYTITNLHRAAKKLSRLNRWLIDWGIVVTIIGEIVDIVKSAPNSTEIPATKGVERLYVPAKTVLWMHKSRDQAGFSFQYSSPVEIADLNILLSTKMIADHLPAQYQQALDAPTRQMTRCSKDMHIGGRGQPTRTRIK